MGEASRRKRAARQEKPEELRKLLAKQRMRKTVLKIVGWGVASQIFWQTFWRYWGEDMLDQLPIALTRSVFILVTGLLVFSFASKVLSKLLPKSPKTHYMIPSVLVVLVVASSPFWIGQISESQDNSTNPTTITNSSAGEPQTQTTPAAQPLATATTNQGSVGIDVENSKGVTINDNTITGYDTPIAVSGSEDVSIQNNTAIK